MKDGVKKFSATDYETEYANGRRGQVLVVPAADYDALLAEVESLRKDAERYRWLRDKAAAAEGVCPMVSMTDDCGDQVSNWLFGNAVDKAIDACMQES